ncbi:hypothetical protein FJ692_29555 [Pseudomonas fluorescens]|nr:hypothetical protein C1751_25535 [Pseudomonas fluorescens]TPV48468.1 hypothetical protein FJ692_29555 [Pseudomonas fluorescens]
MPGFGIAGSRPDNTHLISVGASLLAKNSQAPRLFRQPPLSLTFFASKLAPTLIAAYFRSQRSACPGSQ